MASKVVNMLMNKVMDEVICVPLVGLGLVLDCVAGEVAGCRMRDGQPVSPANHLTSSKSGNSNGMLLPGFYKIGPSIAMVLWFMATCSAELPAVQAARRADHRSPDHRTHRASESARAGGALGATAGRRRM
jgi:hypothetical protein